MSDSPRFFDAKAGDDVARRLRWQCRRGMLELDLLLERFLDTAYPDAEPGVQRAFAELLTLEDTELFDLWKGLEIPSSAFQARVLESLRRPDGFGQSAAI